MKVNILLVLGLFLSVFALSIYFLEGYSTFILTCWLWAIILSSFYFYWQEKEQIRHIKFFNRNDWLFVAILLLIFSPLYLAFIYFIPFQVSSDEIVVSLNARNFLNLPNLDLFGPSPHFGFPFFIFVLWGWLARLMGGVNLLHIRLIHASFGLIIIVLSYLFFRTLSWGKIYAIGGATIIGSQHALLAISRMALRDNTGLLVELITFIFLYTGWKHKSLFYTFLGGLTGGISFYVYQPARIIFFVWLFFLAVYCIFIRFYQQRQVMFKFLSVALIPFLFVISPMTISSFKAPKDLFVYQKEQIMIFTQAKELQREWLSVSTVTEGIKRNIANGFSMFVKNSRDQGYIYVNWDHGFLDPLTRLFLWLGVIVILIKLVIHRKWKSEIKEPDLLVFSGFLFLWLFFTFLLTKNPNYTRLLIFLPFIVYLVLVGLREIINILFSALENSLKKYNIPLSKKSRHCLFFLAVVLIALWNLMIYNKYVITGFQQGNDLGGTGRYIEAKKNLLNYTFFLAADDKYPYYSWGTSYRWQEWIKFFISDGQTIQIINPQNLFSDNNICLSRPSTLFLSNDLYFQIKTKLTKNCYPFQIYHIKPDGSLLAVEFIR